MQVVTASTPHAAHPYSFAFQNGTIPPTVKTLVQSVLRPFGLRLSRLEEPKPDYGARVFFATLKRFGFSPQQVVDIGANHGNWTRGALAYFPEAAYLLVEPQNHLRVYVQDLIGSGYKIQWVNAGVADKPGTMTFYICDRDDSSTFLPREEQPQARVAQERHIEVKTVDQLLSEYDLPVPDVVKIDAEGFDLKVLRGASRLIGKTDVFLLEAGVSCPFENSAARVIGTMEDFGYRLVDITELNRSPKYGVLWLTELAFLRKSSPLFNSVTSYE